ncbi:MAG TPA: RnfABCDGE type electron transport complex subunit D [Firmicutes bacterium]|jgi:electron transport complex protein RnfD|nr:RnfABCDGE type electron transport complex subunit D [Bacillota bacterium]
MDDLKLLVSPSPHVRDTDTTEKIMFAVLIALLPVVAAAIYFFRWDAVRVLLLSAGSAVATETIWQRLRRKPIRIGDGSALITGVLLALSLPPTIPSWMVIVGSAFAIAIGKQVFGGLGHNPFNPALVGRAFMLASFSQAMTKWTPPIDGVSAATPLALGAAVSRVPDLFFGSVAGSLGETSALAILLGGIYLFYKGVIDYRIPVSICATVTVFALLAGEDPIFHLLAGSVLFAAVYMATDMVTSPITKPGRWIFGVGVAVIIMLIRIWGGYPEGVTFAILLMNAATPLINRWTRPRIYGQGVKVSE